MTPHQWITAEALFFVALWIVAFLVAYYAQGTADTTDVTGAESKGKAHGSGHHHVPPVGPVQSLPPSDSPAGGARVGEAS